MQASAFRPGSAVLSAGQIHFTNIKKWKQLSVASTPACPNPALRILVKIDRLVYILCMLRA